MEEELNRISEQLKEILDNIITAEARAKKLLKKEFDECHFLARDYTNDICNNNKCIMNKGNGHCFLAGVVKDGI